jgi:hypothetical protein
VDNQTTYWLFTSPPPPLEWITIFATIVALAMAIIVPSLFLIWQKPKILVSYQGDGYLIYIQLQNLPVNNRFLKWINVERNTIQRLTLSADVKLEGHGFLIPTARFIYFGDDLTTRYKSIMLPASNLAARVMIAGFIYGKARAADEDDIYTIDLPRGEGEIDMTICADGKIIAARKRFIVADEKPFIEWLD